MSQSPTSSGWIVVVPVKGVRAAKSRLALASPLRARVAAAMALDTVAAAVGCPAVAEVVVVTDEAPAEFARLGARVLPDAPRAGLNAALSHGIKQGIRQDMEPPPEPGPEQAMPGARAGVAALAGDLPALRPEELAGALAAVPVPGAAVVADASGSGTTLLAATGRLGVRPQFGPDSHRRHLDGGAADITPRVGPGLRCDVDTLVDLRAAADLGLGRHTAELLGELTPWLPASLALREP